MTDALLQIALTFALLVALAGFWYAVQRLSGNRNPRARFGCGATCSGDTESACGLSESPHASNC